MLGVQYLDRDCIFFVTKVSYRHYDVSALFKSVCFWLKNMFGIRMVRSNSYFEWFGFRMVKKQEGEQFIDIERFKKKHHLSFKCSF